MNIVRGGAWRSGWSPLLLGLLLAGLLVPHRLAAQDDPRLLDIVRAAQEGQIDSAQQALNGLLSATQPTDSLYPQVLYTQGIIARNLDDRRRAYSRITVEYANSSWADDALVQLALLDYAAGNKDEAARKFARLKTDYPGSPLLVTASYWAARSLFDLHHPQEACRWVNDGLAGSANDVETRNQLAWLSGRCSGPQPQDTTRKPDTTAAAPRPPRPAPPGTPGAPAPPAGVKRTGVGVQVGAVNSQALADQLLGSLTSAGFKGYVVKEANLFKVRAGPYPDRASALAAMPNIKKAVGGSPFLVKEP